MIAQERFETLVSEALDSIPQALWDSIDNITVSVEDWPRPDQLVAASVPAGNLLLGLYEGVPLTRRSSGYGLLPPDHITIFRVPILRVCGANDEEAVRRQVRRTVLHEVAHHFGISDERLHQIGAY